MASPTMTTEMDTTGLSWNGSSTSDPADDDEHYSDVWIASVGTILSLIALSTIVGNLLVILSYAKEPRIRSSVGNLYVLNRAIADMIVGTFVIPFATASLLIGEWPFGNIFCQIWTVVESSSTCVSVLSLLLISLDRYWLVTKKLRYQKFQTQQRAGVLICCCWMLCFTFYGITVFAWKPITRLEFPTDLIANCRIQSRNNIYFALVFIFCAILSSSCSYSWSKSRCIQKNTCKIKKLRTEYFSCSTCCPEQRRSSGRNK